MYNTAKLGLLLPAALNPATAAIVGIAAIAVGLYRMLPDDEEKETVDVVARNGSEQSIPTVEARLPAVERGEVEPVREPSNDAQQMALVALETATCQRQSKSEPKGSVKCCHLGVSAIAA